MDLTIIVDGQNIWLPTAAFLGVCVGLIAGMFGVGGGFLLVPLLNVVLGVSWPIAVGAGLCQTIATALGAWLRYRAMGHAESRFDIMLLGGSLLGVDAGARVLEYLKTASAIDIAGRSVTAVNFILPVGYTLLFAITAGLLWFKPSPRDDAPTKPGPLARLRIPPLADLPVAGIPRVSGPVIAVVGFGNGLLAGLLGIGGGITLIPIMLYGFGFDIKKTAGTGIVIVLVVAIVGTVQHARLGNVHLGLAMTLMVGSALSAQVGAGLTRTLSPTVLRKSLAIVLLVTLVAILGKAFLR